MVERPNLSMAEQRALLAQLLHKRIAKSKVAPLSFVQERFWFLEQLEPGNPFYNVPAAIRLMGQLDVAILKQSLTEIVGRHETLRTTFVAQEGQPMQVIAPPRQLPLPVADLCDLPEATREPEAMRLVDAEALRPFDLIEGPLFRANLVRLSEAEHILLLNVHHIVSDGWSTGVMIRELTVLYSAFFSGQPSPLPELAIQYADFVAWQRQWLQGPVLAEQLAYWRQQLDVTAAVVELYTDRPRKPVQPSGGTCLFFSFSRSLCESLEALCQRENVTLFTTLLAAFKVLLHRYTGQTDIQVGTFIANRNHRQIEELIGVFFNVLVLRTDLGGDPTFSQLLRRVHKTTLEAYARQDVSYNQLLKELQPERDRGGLPLFRVLLVLQNTPMRAIELPGLTIERIRLKRGEARPNSDLDLYFEETKEGLFGNVEYNADLFDAATIARLVRHLQTVLEAIVVDPRQCISDLSLLTAAEREQLLVEWNRNETSYPQDDCIHTQVEAQVERAPDAIALVFQDQCLTYRELDRRANQLAHHLRALGVRAEVLVGICMERSLEMVVGILGILKAGGAYVPLDPAYPAERLAFVLQDTRTPVLLTQQQLLTSLPQHKAHTICLDTDWKAVAEEAREALITEAGSANLAYVIYTSGSTGVPKGVLVSHANVVRLFAATQAWFHFDESDVWTLFHSYAFDFSVWELWGGLCYGGQVVVVSYLLSRAPDAFYELLSRQQVTVLNQIPSAFRQLIQAEAASPEAREIALRWVIFGGEALDLQSLKPWFDRHGDERPRLVNMYGITETTVHVTYRPLAVTDLSQSPGSMIGRPIPDLQMYVLDKRRQLVPIGVPGELYVGGAGVARGYHNRSELAAERFVPHPSSDKPGVRLYRTGDWGRYLSSGDVEYLGRIDLQVKIRGFRIELGEIEAVLSQHPAVREAIVMARRDAPGENQAHDASLQLAAYIVAQEGQALTIGELHHWMQVRLPSYMIPSAFVILEAMPLSPNGKVDRRALPAPGMSRTDWGRAFVAPSTPIQEILASIWAKVLGLERVGVRDNFFELGGHSLLATRVVSRIRRIFQVELPLQGLFEEPTVEGLSKNIERAHWAKQDLPVLSPRPVARDRGPALSFAQQRLWFLDQLEPGSPFYNLPAAVHLTGSLAVMALERSLNEIVRRHEALRTTFAMVDGQPVQVIAPTMTMSLPVVDLGECTKAEREVQTRRWATKEARRPFDLTRGPLVRGVLLRQAADEHVLLLTMHHIVSDGWSVGILIREMATLYPAYCADQPSPLPELPIQYADFALWQREWLTGEKWEAEFAYWRRQLGGSLPVIEMPTDRPRPRVQSLRGATSAFTLSGDLSEKLQALSRREQVTLFMTLLAAFQVLLHRYTGQSDLVVGTPIANRNQIETEELIGFFVNTLVLRTDVSGHPTFQELLGRVRDVALGAYAHQDMPFEQLVDALEPERNLSYTPLFQVMFVLQNAPRKALEAPGLGLHVLAVSSGTAKFDMTLSMVEAEPELRGEVEYNTDLFDEATITRLVGHLKTLLEGIVANPTRRLAELPLLTEAELHQLLVEWNDTQIEYPRDLCIHELFQAQVEQTPDAVAVVLGEDHLSYLKVNCCANRLARRLQALGVGPETLVGICVERSMEMILGILGILKVGGAYVPLDPDYPQERLTFMLEDTRAPVLLTQPSLRGRFPDCRAKVICLEADRHAGDRLIEANLSDVATADNLAYVMYTSGSTGKPKGVSVVHWAVVRLVKGVNYANLMARQILLQFAPISFDASTLEIWGSLANGARLVIFPPYTPSLKELGDLVQEQQVTWLWLTAGLFHLVVDERLEDLRKVHWLLAGGDVLSASHVQKALDLDGCQIINGYGPTENTTFTTCYPVRSDSRMGASVPIGRPIANTQVYLLDSDLRPVPIGVAGELYAGGDGLARDYLNRPALTAEKFVPNPFTCLPRFSLTAADTKGGNRLYRTGDLARYLPDGNIEFLGRIDQQVKLRGFRVELGEVEAVLGQHPAVRKVVVMAREDQPGDKRLVAYLTTDHEPLPDVSELRYFMQEKLPEYMLPSAFVFLETWPLTPNGKVDRRALPAPEWAGLDLVEVLVAPRDSMELRLVQIWEDVLDVHPIGVRHNFFELGGHSLLAVRLMGRIEQELGLRLPVALLFQGATIEHLAAVLRQRRDSAPSLLVTMQTGKADVRPLFFVHPASGNVLCYADLVRCLGSDQPCYALQAQGLDDVREPETRVEAMAGDYIQLLRTVQPEGPYQLGGWSLGGVVAFEMAQQLVAQGEEVRLLALIDSYVPTGAPEPDDIALLGGFAQDLGLAVEGVALDGERLRQLGSDERLAFVLDQAKQADILSPDIELIQVHRLFHVFKSNVEAMRRYVPRAYPGPVMLFKAEEPLSGQSASTDSGWDALAGGGLTVQTVPGNHYTMVRGPNVGVLAGRLKQCLDIAIHGQ